MPLSLILGYPPQKKKRPGILGPVEHLNHVYVHWIWSELEPKSKLKSYQPQANIGTFALGLTGLGHLLGMITNQATAQFFPSQIETELYSVLLGDGCNVGPRQFSKEDKPYQIIFLEPRAMNLSREST